MQYRGIAQLVEQRSPKPRAVSSRLTTPATNAQSCMALCVLFCPYLLQKTKFTLDKCVLFRYNKTRSAVSHR